MAEPLPGHARTVVVGGGIAGALVAYHLTRMGMSEVVAVERGTLTCGTSWHAAGLVMQCRSTHSMTAISSYNAELYNGLEADTGQAIGFKQNGTLALARNPDRMYEMKRSASVAKSFGIRVDLLTPGEAKDIYPAIDETLVAGAMLIHGDGQLNPVDVVMSLFAGARQRGARIFENTPVERLERLAGGQFRLHTPSATIDCEKVILCCGLWTRDLAAQLGVRVPLYACEHMYVVTEPLDLVKPDLPILRDCDGYVYIKEEAGKLLVGAFEPRGKALPVERLPGEQKFIEMQEDWDHFELPYSKAMEMVPQLADVGIATFMNGPESFTPDSLFMMGEAPGVPGCFVFAGLNSEGFEVGPGASRALAEWIVAGAPTMDLSDVDIARYHAFQVNPKYLHDRAGEALGAIYEMHWPHKQHQTARQVRKSPLHDRLAALNACFGETAGWERAMWFAPEGVKAKDVYSHQRSNWYPHVAEECRVARKGVILIDQSSFGKHLIQGRDACAYLQRMCVGDLDVPVGKLTYTHMLNPRGGIECDVTINRLAEDRYLLVSSAGPHSRDQAWMTRHLDDAEHVTLTDATSAYCVLSVQGPKSRELLQGLTGADLSNEAFPFATSREIDLGYATVLATRITFIGELGWELTIPSEFTQYVFDLVVEAGAEFALKHAGYHALEHMRCERAYREFDLDLTPDDTPYEAGLGFIVKMDKPGGFIGREAIAGQKGKTLNKRLVMFRLKDSEPVLFHDEPIRLEGGIVGYLSSGAYGFTLGTSVGMGYVHHPDGVSRELVEGGAFEIEIACERYPAQASLQPFFDPRGERVKV